MSARPDEFLIPKDQALSLSGFSRRSKSERLPGISRTSRRYLFFWARNAIYHSLKALDIHPGECVLVPAFICDAAVQPIEAYGAKVVYYAVGRDCAPEFSDVEAKIDGSTRAILAVHYFGFPCGIRKIREICDRRRLFLIEDCAHVLRAHEGDQLLGTFGEASVFSWRKFLPIYDGGELVLNHWERDLSLEWRKENVVFTLRAAKNLLEAALPGPLASALARLRLPKSSPGTIAAPDLRPSAEVQLQRVDPNSTSFDMDRVNLRISSLSRALLEHCDIEEVVTKRRDNYLYLQQRIGDVRGVRPLFDGLPAGVCPWIFPLFFDGMPNAHLPLRKLGIPAVTWGGVRPSGVTSAEFPAADFLYENLIFLPIHQDLGRKELDLIVDKLRTVQANGRTDGGL